VQPARGELRQQLVQLTEANQRLAADDGDVDRPVAIDQRVHSVDQRLALEVADLAQSGHATQVIVSVCVAAGAAQWALTCDLDGERGRIAS
jgi:hypothetical protein